MLVAMLGILMAGSRRTALTPAIPKTVSIFILQDSGAKVVLTHSALRDRLSAGPVHIVCLDHWPTSQEAPDAAPLQTVGTLAPRPMSSTTSGSTGRPGVVIEHRNAVAFCCWARSVFSAKELSGVLAATSICFDLSVFELFVPLCWGQRRASAECAGHFYPVGFPGDADQYGSIGAGGAAAEQPAAGQRSDGKPGW